MAVSFASYEIPRSGLTVNERALTVTGHNISNVNTPGYVRQQAMITTGPVQSSPNKYGLFQFGLGADIQEIRQIRHTFLDNIYRQESTTYGYWEARSKTFQDVQAVLGEPMGAGFQNVMNQFWDSWQELSKNPDSLTVRALVRQRGEALTHHINHLGDQLDKLQEDLNSEINVRIDEINQITEKIAALNVEILKTEVSSDSANDYRDQRNSLLDRLCKLVNVEVNEMQDGQLDITLGGYFLVTKGVQTRLYADESQAGGNFLVPKIVGTNIEIPVRSGILKGLMESRGEVFGATGSFENGTPNTKADISFAIDVSDTSGPNLAKIQASISTYVSELNKKGMDYNLRLITYDGTGVLSNVNHGNDTAAFSASVAGLSATLNAGNDFGSVVTALSGAAYRPDAAKYALVFSGESIGGDGNVLPDATVDAYANSLLTNGIKTSVITSTAYYTAGDAGEKGWDSITAATGGKLYDTSSADFDPLLTTVNADVNISLNEGISVIQDENNIISNLRKRLNALINIMAREVNYLHSSGKTMGVPPLNGSDFFSAIDPTRPLEMGNIKLNDNLLNLNNIVASASGANGDNNIALDIANLRNNTIIRDINGTISIDDYYQSVILSVGSNGSDADRISQNQLKLVQSADSYRNSVMGVSMDEEMTNMMKYKFAYNACSRAINVIDEMLESVINRLGIVGR